MSFRTQLIDTAERVVWTFVQAFGASVGVTGQFGLMALKIAGAAGALAAIKELSVKTTTAVRAGGNNNASTP